LNRVASGKNSIVNWQLLRLCYLAGSLGLPIATGLIAALGQFPNGWNGQVEDFVDTFVDYALPFPVAAGCLQWIHWPMTVGVALVLSLFRKFRILVGVLLVWLPVYLVWQVNEWSVYYAMFPIIDALFVALVTVIWWRIQLRKAQDSEWERGLQGDPGL
jgi:hypothetical protein